MLDLREQGSNVTLTTINIDWSKIGCLPSQMPRRPLSSLGCFYKQIGTMKIMAKSDLLFFDLFLLFMWLYNHVLIIILFCSFSCGYKSTIIFICCLWIEYISSLDLFWVTTLNNAFSLEKYFQTRQVLGLAQMVERLINSTLLIWKICSRHIKIPMDLQCTVRRI